MRFSSLAKGHRRLFPRLRHVAAVRGRSAAAPHRLGFVPSPHNMRTAIDKSNIAGNVACAVAYQKGRHRTDISDDRRFVER